MQIHGYSHYYNLLKFIEWEFSKLDYLDQSFREDIKNISTKLSEAEEKLHKALSSD